VTATDESVVAAARDSSGLATVYRALDELVDLYALDDAAVVVDVPGFGRQVLHAGRRPLRNDEQGLHAAEPGLYLDPPLDDQPLHDQPLHDQMVSRLMVALGALALRHDAGTATST
jgi:D-serine deaminase-like pyridoxal phosphate-dependent protein